MKEKRKLNIAIDYDGTYTEAPDIWNSVIKSFLMDGHMVYCITMRYENPVTNKKHQFVDGLIYESSDVLNSVGLLCPVIFTNRKAKRKHIEDLGLKIDIWIDDRPDYILNNAF